MIGYSLLLHLIVAFVVHARPSNDYSIFKEILENDANLNNGFDLVAFRQNQLDLHNYYRSLHGVPPMTKDDTLTAAAQEYAETLASNNVGLLHCNLPSCDRQGAGENLAMASGHTTVETNATKQWYDEIWFYDFCSENGGQRPDHEGKMVGHFTQVVWKNSTLLGIGYARTADKTSVYVVARYNPHGNHYGEYAQNVLVPSYILNTYENNCNGIDGELSAWSTPGECSRSCGGGVQFKTRTCTNPKPSLNGRDCEGSLKAIAVHEWCNEHSCTGDKNHRDLQCEARGKNPIGREFSPPCKLYCQPIGGGTYMPAGLVDDGTHCSEGTGACLAGTCHNMPTYSPPTTPPPTDATGQIVGQYTGTPGSSIWANMFFEIPNGATNVVVKNHAYNNVEIYVGYKVGFSMGYDWYEHNWMGDGNPVYTDTHTTVGVSYEYERVTGYSTFTFAGPAQPFPGYTLVLFAKGSVPADISWSYNAPITA